MPSLELIHLVYTGLALGTAFSNSNGEAAAAAAAARVSGFGAAPLAFEACGLS